MLTTILITLLVIGLVTLVVFAKGKYFDPYIDEKVRAKVKDLQISSNKEVAQVQNTLNQVGTISQSLLDHVETIPDETIREMKLSELSDVGQQMELINKNLKQLHSSLSNRAQKGGSFFAKEFFANGGNKQYLLQDAATKAGFFGAQAINNFLVAVATKVPEINNREKFLQLPQDRREAIIKKVKINNV